MSRTYCLIGCIVLIALLVVPATAEVTRVMGMGGTAVAVDRGASTIGSNPALLSGVNDTPIAPGWNGSAEATFAIGDDVTNIQILNVAMYDASTARGFGVGYINLMGFADVYAGGYGQAIPGVPGLSAGLGVAYLDLPFGFDETILNAGLAYQTLTPAADYTFGVLFGDVFDQVDSTMLLGAAATLPSGVTLAIDWVDVGGADNLNFGGEYATGPMAFRVGTMDTNLTAGAAYSFNAFTVSLAYLDLGWGTEAWFAGGEFDF